MRSTLVALVLVLVLASCGGAEPLAAGDSLGIDVEEVAPGEAFPVQVVRVWPKDEEPRPFDTSTLAPLVLRLESSQRRTDETHVEETLSYRAYAFTLEDVQVPGVGTIRVVPTLPAEAPGDPERPTLPAPTRAPWWPWATGALALLLAGAWLAARTRSPGEEERPTHDGPAVRALRRLEAIRTRRGGRPRTDVAAVADVLRDYASATWHIGASVKTTPEILRALPAPVAGGLAPLLRRGDLVKFAAWPVDDEAREAAIREAEGFVRARQEA